MEQTFQNPSFHRRRLTARQAQELFDQHALSGVGIMEFCRSRGVSYARLKYWRDRLEQLGEGSSIGGGFVELRPPSSPPALLSSSIASGSAMASSGVTIRVGALNEHIQIDVSRGFDAGVLCAVIKALT